MDVKAVYRYERMPAYYMPVSQPVSTFNIGGLDLDSIFFGGCYGSLDNSGFGGSIPREYYSSGDFRAYYDHSNYDNYFSGDYLGDFNSNNFYPLFYGMELYGNNYDVYTYSPLGATSNPFDPNMNLNSISHTQTADQTQQIQEDSQDPTVTEHDVQINVTKEQKKAALKRIKQIAKKYKCNYRDLIAVMNAESGIQTNRWNGRTAVGLIQFTQVACDEFKRVYGLNVTKDQIAKMSMLEQLDLVDKYLEMTLNANPRLKGKKISRGDLYALVFLPGRSGREILCTRDEREHPEYYRQNRGLDLNRDGQITKSELAQRVSDFYVTDESFLS